MAAALAPSTTLLTFSSKLQETRETAGLRPKALLTDTGRTVWVFSNLEVDAKEADTLHPTEATEAAMAAQAPSALPAINFPTQPKSSTIADAQELQVACDT